MDLWEVLVDSLDSVDSLGAGGSDIDSGISMYASSGTAG